MKAWRTLNRRQVLSFGKFLTVERHEIQLPDGRIIDDWPWLITPDYVNVVAVTAEEQFLLFQQEKYAIDGETLALVGGYIEPGEEPADAVRRELLEETGYTAAQWIDLGQFRVDTNRGAGMGYFYLALNAQPTAQPIVDDLEEQHLLLLDRQQVEQALFHGEIKGMPWAAAIALALLWFAQRKR